MTNTLLPRTSQSARRHRSITVAGALICAGVLAAIPTSVALGSGADAKTASRPTPAPQMHQLDFLLGKLRCLYSSGTKLTARTKPILSGTYVQMEITASQALGSSKLNGRWILGWDSVNSHFISYYYDDGLNQGTSTSPGWQGGHFVLTGTYALGGRGVSILLKDDFVPKDADHFTIVESGQINGTWRVLDTQACVRSPLS